MYYKSQVQLPKSLDARNFPSVETILRQSKEISSQKESLRLSQEFNETLSQTSSIKRSTGSDNRKNLFIANENLSLGGNNVTPTSFRKFDEVLQLQRHKEIIEPIKSVSKEIMEIKLNQNKVFSNIILM